MLPVNCGSHSDYQNFVVENLRKYSKYGPAPRNPSCMQRSYLLSIDFKVTSVTEWAAQLKINPLYAIVSGFEVGVGTFYDFFSRLWDSENKNLNPHLHKLKIPVKKPKKKGYKAQPTGKVTVDQLLKNLEKQSFSIDEQPYASLFDLYTKEFLRKSLEKGLINNTHLSIAGDGTSVVTSARERKHRICDCASKGIHGCDCERYFSQPDCDVGWDSSRGYFYHGYDLYMLVASDSKYGRTVHLAMKDNPRLINIHPRDSKQWKSEYNARTSAERSNKREKIDFKLESGRHRSTKMWYCRLYHILMLQHLDAWDLPFESTLRKLILNVA